MLSVFVLGQNHKRGWGGGEFLPRIVVATITPPPLWCGPLMVDQCLMTRSVCGTNMEMFCSSSAPHRFRGITECSASLRLSSCPNVTYSNFDLFFVKSSSVFTSSCSVAGGEKKKSPRSNVHSNFWKKLPENVAFSAAMIMAGRRWPNGNFDLKKNKPQTCSEVWRNNEL